jgi:molybdopterin converting factor small subunit
MLGHMEEDAMRVVLTTNVAGGFSRTIEIDEGTTVGDLLSRYGDSEALSHSRIQVNRKQARLNDILQPDDRIRLVPPRIVGAYSADQSEVGMRADSRPSSRLGSSGGDEEMDGPHRDPVIEMLRRRAESIPPEIQRQMFDELKRAMNENRASGRTLFP